MGKLTVEIAFLGDRFEQVADPDRALEALIGLLQRLNPATIDFTHRIHAAGSTTRLVVDLGPGRASELDLLRRAVLRAEGAAGLVAHFPPPDAADPFDGSDWLHASAELDAPALPGNIGFGVPLPLAAMLPALFRQLALAGAHFGYHARFERAGPAPAAAHALARALAVARTSRGALALLGAPIGDAVALTANAGLAVAEYLMVHADWAEACGDLIEEALVANLHQCCPGISFDAMAIAWDRSAAAPLNRGAQTLHSLVAERRPADYLSRALTAGLAAASEAGGRVGPGPVPSPGAAGATPPAPPSRPFAFLSYAHRDAPQAAQLVAGLRDRGLSIWFDEGIRGGELWDECLEQRIRGAELLIACLSPSFEASRYCRREIKFADLLGKPILPFSPQACTWGPGLALTFVERQILVAAVPAELERISSHALALAPACGTAH